MRFGNGIARSHENSCTRSATDLQFSSSAIVLIGRSAPLSLDCVSLRAAHAAQRSPTLPLTPLRCVRGADNQRSWDLFDSLSSMVLVLLSRFRRPAFIGEIL